MKRQPVIIREDLLSKSEFSRSYGISRNKLDALIYEGRLPVEQICGVAFINIANKRVVNDALIGSSHSVSDYKTPSKPKVTDNDTFDSKLDRDYAEWEKNNP